MTYDELSASMEKLRETIDEIRHLIANTTVVINGTFDIVDAIEVKIKVMEVQINEIYKKVIDN